MRRQAAQLRKGGSEEGLSDIAAEVLAKLLNAEACSINGDSSSGCTPLMTLVRSLDSHAAQHIQQVQQLHRSFLLEGLACPCRAFDRWSGACLAVPQASNRRRIPFELKVITSMLVSRRSTCKLWQVPVPSLWAVLRLEDSGSGSTSGVHAGGGPGAGSRCQAAHQSLLCTRTFAGCRERCCTASRGGSHQLR